MTGAREPVGVQPVAAAAAVFVLRHATVAAALSYAQSVGDTRASVGAGVWGAAGVPSMALIGHRFVFIGPEAAVGRVSDERGGADFGAFRGVQLRLEFGW